MAQGLDVGSSATALRASASPTHPSTCPLPLPLPSAAPRRHQVSPQSHTAWRPEPCRAPVCVCACVCVCVCLHRINSPHSALTLRSDYQAQMRELHGGVGYTYTRIHAPFARDYSVAQG